MVVAHLPIILLVVTVVILFIDMVADTEELHAAWYGMLSTVGIFAPAVLGNVATSLSIRRKSGTAARMTAGAIPMFSAGCAAGKKLCGEGGNLF